jgi:iron(III) transport system ATP-binding protein
MPDAIDSAGPARGCEVNIQSVSKAYGHVTVLTDVSMTVKPGEFLRFSDLRVAGRRRC